MQLRILTYNIHRAIGIDRRFRPERIVRILDHYDADICLLQEVDEGAPRSRELNLAKELAEAAGYPHVAAGYNVSLRKGRYGNATLSKFPIVRERNIDLTIGKRKRRGCQHTTIEAEVRKGHMHQLEIFNLHLGLSARERERQAGLLVRSEEFAALEETTSCLVAGDFNDWRSRLRPIFTEALLFASASERKSHPVLNRDIRTYPSFSPSGALDKVFYRGGLTKRGCFRCRMQVSKVASDHSPLIADFELHD
jgi:endonuclease/exonuclease/phosphatase family metal-dependent hydrolase